MEEIIDPQAPTRAPGAKPPLEVLAELIATPNTPLCLVFGDDAHAERTALKAAVIAGKDECAPIVVVRIRNAATILDPTERAWKPPGDEILTLLRSDRTVSSTMTAAEAAISIKLFRAMLRAIGGE